MFAPTGDGSSSAATAATAQGGATDGAGSAVVQEEGVNAGAPQGGAGADDSMDGMFLPGSLRSHSTPLNRSMHTPGRTSRQRRPKSAEIADPVERVAIVDGAGDEGGDKTISSPATAAAVAAAEDEGQQAAQAAIETPLKVEHRSKPRKRKQKSSGGKKSRMAAQVLDEQDSLLEQVDHIFEAGGDKALGVFNEWVNDAVDSAGGTQEDDLTADAGASERETGDGEADTSAEGNAIAGVLNSSSVVVPSPLLSPPKSSSTPVLARKVPSANALKLEFQPSTAAAARAVPSTRVVGRGRGGGGGVGDDDDVPSSYNSNANVSALASSLDASTIDGAPDEDNAAADDDQAEAEAFVGVGGTSDKPAESCSEFFVSVIC
jgi:hypothetical protein